MRYEPAEWSTTFPVRLFLLRFLFGFSIQQAQTFRLRTDQAGVCVDEQLGPAVGDVEVTHCQLADAVHGSECAFAFFSMVRRSGA